MNPLAVVGLVFLGLLLFSKRQAVYALTFNINGVNFEGGSLKMNCVVINPASSDITLTSFLGNLFIGTTGDQIASVYSQGQVIIPAGGTVTIPLKVVLNAIGIAEEVSALIQGGQNNKFKLVATINAEGIMFNQTFNF